MYNSNSYHNSNSYQNSSYDPCCDFNYPESVKICSAIICCVLLPFILVFWPLGILVLIGFGILHCISASFTLIQRGSCNNSDTKNGLLCTLAFLTIPAIILIAIPLYFFPAVFSIVTIVFLATDQTDSYWKIWLFPSLGIWMTTTFISLHLTLFHYTNYCGCTVLPRFIKNPILDHGLYYYAMIHGYLTGIPQLLLITVNFVFSKMCNENESCSFLPRPDVFFALSLVGYLLNPVVEGLFRLVGTRYFGGYGEKYEPFERLE